MKPKIPSVQLTELFVTNKLYNNYLNKTNITLQDTLYHKLWVRLYDNHYAIINQIAIEAHKKP